MTSRSYQICTRCVMDTSDPDIHFNTEGVCNHCLEREERLKRLPAGEAAQNTLLSMVEQIRREGRNKPYDCIIGISGGVDSSYVALKVKELGLRPLAVHLDNGWNSELSVSNIHNALTRLGIELYTHVIDWEEFRDLQLSFLKASTPDGEIPSDHAIFALMRRMAQKFGVRWIITGMNIRTETHLPRAWAQGHNDWKYVRSVHQQFGTRPLKTYPHMGFWTYYSYRLLQKQLDILNYLDYVKQDAMRELETSLGWRYYGGKHYESIYTRFYQGYLLPQKFGFDKRRSHFSSLICSGEMTREEALEELTQPAYPPELQAEDCLYVAKKLEISQDEFNRIMALPPRKFEEFPSYEADKGPLFKKLRTLYRTRQETPKE